MTDDLDTFMADLASRLPGIAAASDVPGVSVVVVSRGRRRTVQAGVQSTATSAPVTAATAPQTQAPAAASPPAGSICLASDASNLAEYETDNYRVVICQISDGETYYFGWSKENGNSITLRAFGRSDGGWSADNQGTTYSVGPGRLTVVSPSGKVLIDEAIW